MNAYDKDPTAVAAAELEPRIYVVSVRDLQEGRWLGRWISASLSPDLLRAEIDDLLSESSHGSNAGWAIKISEGFENLRLPECPDLGILSRLAESTVRHGPVFPRLVVHRGGLFAFEDAVAEAHAWMEQHYRGCYESMAEYAESFLWWRYEAALEALPWGLQSAIDFDNAGWTVLVYNGRTSVIEERGRIHIFAEPGRSSAEQFNCGLANASP